MNSCLPNLELLTIKCHPFYFPREFNSVISIPVYIPPQAMATALPELHDALVIYPANHRDAALTVAITCWVNRLWTTGTHSSRTGTKQSLPAFGKSEHATIFLLLSTNNVRTGSSGSEGDHAQGHVVTQDLSKSEAVGGSHHP